MRYIDTHAHYNDKVYEENLKDVLDNVIKNNVDKIINVGYDIESSKRSIELSNEYNYIYCSIGIHPHDVEKYDEDKLMQLYDLGKSKIVAIGEIGLDYAYTKDNKDKQIDIFIRQIKLAEKLNLPIIVHSRDASLDTLNVIKNNVNKDAKVLFHCFSPTEELVNLIIARGYTVSFGGNITYPRNDSFAKYIDLIPLNQIVIETDCPYLSPVPLRGKINTSASLSIILDKLAEYKNIDKNTLSEIVYNNSIKFFNL